MKHIFFTLLFCLGLAGTSIAAPSPIQQGNPEANPNTAGIAQDVYFAIRTDGTSGTITSALTRNSDGTITVPGTAKISGTGTKSDPYDASGYLKFDGLMRMLGRPVSTTFSGSITSVSTGNPAIVTTALPHGLRTGVLCTQSGVSGTASPTINAGYPITKIDDYRYSIPVNCTVAGSGGTFSSTYGVVPPITVHLGAGTFLTQGVQTYKSTYTVPAYNAANYPFYFPPDQINSGWFMYPGWRLLGQGAAATEVKLASWPDFSGSPYPYGNTLIASSYGSWGYDGDDVEIAELTANENWDGVAASRPPSGDTAANGINLFGSRFHVHDVQVIGTYGDSATAHECFSCYGTAKLTEGYLLAIGYPDVSTPSRDAIFERIVFPRDYLGDYGGAITLEPQPGGNGIIRDCFVKDFGSTRGGTAAIGFGSGTVIDGNTLVNCVAGMYSEGGTGVGSYQTVIRGNHILASLGPGITCSLPAAQSYSDLEVSGNVIEIAFDPSPSSTRAPWGIHMDKSLGNLTNVKIRNNWIFHTGTQGSTPTFSPYGIACTNVTGLTITDNVMDTVFGNNMSGNANVLLRNNRYTDQTVAANLSDTALPTSMGGTNATSWTAGSIPYLSSSATFGQDNSNFFWDGTNHRLGIGLTNPSYKLDISGDINISSSSIYRINGSTFAWTDTTHESTYFGVGAGNISQTGIRNIGIGPLTMSSVSSGASNVAIGHHSMIGITTGTGNIGIGDAAAQQVGAENDNTMIGNDSGYLTSGNTGSTFLGSQAGRNAGSSGLFDTFLGYGANFNGISGLTNSTAIGANSQVTASNCFVLGATASGGTQVNVSIGNTAGSDLLDIGKTGTITGAIRLQGATSGYTRIVPSDAAGSWTLKLPTSSGTAGQYLSTDGSGNTSWASAAQVANTISLTNQSADIGSTNAATAAGLYRVSYSLQDTTSDATAGTVTLTFGYTDGAGATTSASAAQLLTGTGRTSGSIYIQLSSGNITYSTSHTGIFGSAKYALYISVEKLN